MRIRFPCFTILAVCLVLSSPSIGAGADRGQTIRQAIQGMNLEKDEMAAMVNSKLIVGKSYLGTHAWIPLETCNGSLVIYMNRYNRYLGMRTTGDCTIEDLKAR